VPALSRKDYDDLRKSKIREIKRSSQHIIFLGGPKEKLGED